MNHTPIDLGLPSGLLWAAENEPAADGGALLSFTDANAPGTGRTEKRWEVPGRKAYEELARCCSITWDRDRGEAVVTGPNGNTLAFPAAGWGHPDGEHVFNERTAFYWTADRINRTGSKQAALSLAYNFLVIENRRDEAVSVRAVPVDSDPDNRFCVRKVRRAPAVDDIAEEGDALREEIAEAHGHNVTYCESMDMDLVALIVDCVKDEAFIDGALGDLRFYASNGRGLSETFSEASAEEFKAYFRRNRGAILVAVQDILDEYRSCDYPEREDGEKE